MSATITASELKAIEKALCERSFYQFTKLAWHTVDPAPFKDNWHIQVLCDHLQAVFEGKIKNLLINITPGTGKSLITNVFFPAWVWTTRKDKSFLSVAHKEDLAIRDAVKMRRVCESDWYSSHWTITLRKDQNSKANFENDAFGYRVCSPMANSTGKRANYILVDDPHAVKEAQSDAFRKSAVDVFRETLPTRVNDPEKDSMIVIMQRLHTDDVSGYILENRESLEYDHLCIPYVADGCDRPATSIGWTDPRKEGEMMWPDHFDKKTLEARKVSLGPYGFAGQFQQNPVPDNDGFFNVDWFHRFKPDELPTNLHKYMTSDHAPSGKGDYNVFRIWGVDCNRHIWLVDSFRKKCQMDEALGINRSDGTGRISLRATGALPLIQKHKPFCWFPESDPTWIANRPFIETAMRDTMALCQIKTLPMRMAGDKVAKAQPYQALASAGFVHLPEGEVGDDALEEYRNFPAGKHDDQVDADSAIARALSDAHAAYVPYVPPKVVRHDDDDWSQGSSDRDLAWG